MDKAILVQYCEMKEEIRDLRQRIQKLDRFLEHPPVVSDTVRGTRKDGTTGPIRITGIPNPEYCRKQNARQRYQLLLGQKEAELLDMLRASDGQDAVVIYCKKEKAVKRLAANRSVNADKLLLNKLTNYLGESCVKVIEKPIENLC